MEKPYPGDLKIRLNMNLLEISSYLFRDLREFPGDLTCMCGSANLYNFASVTWVPMLNTTRPGYQRHRKTARNYTTVTRFENVKFRVMRDNLQHFLLVHMLLQTRELHNQRPWALLFYLPRVLANFLIIITQTCLYHDNKSIDKCLSSYFDASYVCFRYWIVSVQPSGGTMRCDETGSKCIVFKKKCNNIFTCFCF